MTTLSWSRGRSSATVDLDDGARMTELVLAGESLLVPPGDRDPMWWGAFVMAPWTSLLRPDVVPGYAPEGDDAWHGSARRLSWRQGVDGATADLSGPFDGLSVELATRLGDSDLMLRLTVRSAGPDVAVALGWHPWFPRRLRGVEGKLRLRGETIAQARDDAGRPTGLWESPTEGRWNNGARLVAPAIIAYEGVGEIEIDSSSPYAIIFEHDQGICIEPTTAPAESLGHMVTPADPLELVIRIAWICAGATPP